MNKKVLIFLLSLAAIAVFTACVGEEGDTLREGDTSRDESSITIISTNVSGAEAVPVAFSVYEQIMALIEPGFGAQTGYDADFVMRMSADTLMSGMPMGTTTSVTTGNMRANIDGNRMQSATVMNTSIAMDMYGEVENMDMTMEMYMEMDGTNITFFHMLVDGEIFDDPMITEMMDGLPDMNIPDFTMDAVTSANVAEVGNETHVSISLDAAHLSDFVDDIVAGMMGAMMGMDMEMDVQKFDMVFIVDNAGNLARLIMDMDITVDVEMDLGVEVLELTMIMSSSTEFAYNHIGPVDIVMPGR